MNKVVTQQHSLHFSFTAHASLWSKKGRRGNKVSAVPLQVRVSLCVPPALLPRVPQDSRQWGQTSVTKHLYACAKGQNETERERASNALPLFLSLSFYEWAPLPPHQQGYRCRRMGRAHLISCFNKPFLTEPLPGSLLKPWCTLIICIKHKRLQLIDPCSLSIWGHSDIVWAADLSRFFTCSTPCSAWIFSTLRLLFTHKPQSLYWSVEKPLFILVASCYQWDWSLWGGIGAGWRREQWQEGRTYWKALSGSARLLWWEVECQEGKEELGSDVMHKHTNKAFT